MAEAALLGVAKSVLEQLSSSSLKEFLLVWNFNKDLKRLEETIQTITNFLHDAEQRQSTNHVVKGWLYRLRAVLYDADDLFDAVAARALRKKAMNGNAIRKEVRLFFSKSNQLGFVFKTAHNVKAIRECLDNIHHDMLPFQFQSRNIEDSLPLRALDRDETHSFVDSKNVFGRDQEKEDLINLLLSEDPRQQNLSVISIIGFGGLGKTTLAQLVYNDKRVQTGFDLCLWVCVNYFSDLKSVLVAILTSALKSKPQDLDLDQLQGKLRDSIGGKKFLLVLDDVWDENASDWARLETLLNCGKSGSKVFATTRNTKVAQCLDAMEPYYKLSVLSEESAWSLLVKMAFKDGEFSNEAELVMLGKQIVRKCGYVPLALTTIGRVLRYRKKEHKLWLSFLEKELPEVLLDDTDSDKLMQVLKVSYNDLPPALKHCLAYCSLFPKDHVFDKDVLVRMWLAQGFYNEPPHAKKSLVEVGDEYFFHMVDRCFFQEVERRSWNFGHIKYTCKMHDLLHDLAIQVAGLEFSCFCEKDFKDMVERSVLRHISVICTPDFSFDYSIMSSHAKTLRTLRFDDAKHLETGSLNLIVARFRMLRTLELGCLEFEKLPDSFGELIHLRYLNLSWSYNLIALPNSICKLHHLQTLILDHCRSLKKLPSNLGKLVSLRHLLFHRCDELDSLPSGLAALTSLVTLDRFIVHHQNGGLRYLGRLDDLCGTVNIELPMNGWSDCIEDARKANMSSKGKLSGMSIEWVDGQTCWEGERSEEEAKAVLEELGPHENLQYLRINRHPSGILPSWFSSLSSVKELSLKYCDSLEYLDVSVKSGDLLPCLEFLELSDLPSLKGWWRELASSGDNNAPTAALLPRLPCVSRVVIKQCPNLMGNMPLFGAIEDLKLSEVNVKLVNNLLGGFPNMHRSTECHDYNNKLKVLDLDDIKDLECLPEGSIKYFTALKSLTIQHCSQLSWVSSRGLAHLTSLEELTIWDLVRLEDEDDEKVENIKGGLAGAGMPWKALQRLRHLRVHWQSHLLGGIQYLTSLEELEIHYFASKQVEADNQEDREMLLLWNGLERLQTLSISFRTVPRCCFPNWTQHLPFLKSLSLENCEEIIFDDSVGEQQIQFYSLVSLSIVQVLENGSWIHGLPWKRLFPSLQALSLRSITKLRILPNGVQQLTSLQKLWIYDCEEIEAIPNWMINLTSLQQLTIHGCSPELGKRCERDTGVDWPLISHIPRIQIY